MSQAEWIASRPVTPLYFYDIDGNRRLVVNQTEIDARAEQADPFTLEDYLAEADRKKRPARLAAIADALDLTVDEVPKSGITLDPPEPDRTQAWEPPEGTPRHGDDASHPSEQAAIRWSAAHLLPKHNKQRPSQTREGRRRRYVRMKAERLGRTVKSVEQTTRRYQPRQPKEQPQ